MSFRPNDFSHDCCIVAGAATDMNYMAGRLYLQLVKQRSQKAWVTVVKLTTWIDGNEDIVIELFRICILRRPIVLEPRAHDLPRSRPKEALSRNLREGCDERF